MKLGSILDDRQYRNSTIDPFSLFLFYRINRWREEKEYLEKKMTCLAFFSFSPRRFRVRELPRLTSLVTCHENLSLCREIIVVYRVLYSYPLPQRSSPHCTLYSFQRHFDVAIFLIGGEGRLAFIPCERGKKPHFVFFLRLLLLFKRTFVQISFIFFCREEPSNTLFPR